MIKNLEKIFKVLVVFSLIAMVWVYFAPEPIGALTVSATVSSTMVTCETPASTAAFGTVDNTSVYQKFTTTTVSSSGAIYLKMYGTGSGAGDNPGLWVSPNLIESPTGTTAIAPATTTLVAGSEGYGAQATTTPAGTALDINRRYYNWGIATTSGVVGGLATTSGSQFTVASSGSSVSSSTLSIIFKVAVGVSTPGGAYSDTVTYSCTAS